MKKLEYIETPFYLYYLFTFLNVPVCLSLRMQIVRHSNFYRGYLIIPINLTQTSLDLMKQGNNYRHHVDELFFLTCVFSLQRNFTLSLAQIPSGLNRMCMTHVQVRRREITNFTQYSDTPAPSLRRSRTNNSFLPCVDDDSFGWYVDSGESRSLQTECLGTRSGTSD